MRLRSTAPRPTQLPCTTRARIAWLLRFGRCWYRAPGIGARLRPAEVAGVRRPDFGAGRSGERIDPQLCRVKCGAGSGNDYATAAPRIAGLVGLAFRQPVIAGAFGWGELPSFGEREFPAWPARPVFRGAGERHARFAPLGISVDGAVGDFECSPCGDHRAAAVDGAAVVHREHLAGIERRRLDGGEIHDEHRTIEQYALPFGSLCGASLFARALDDP